jgi:hypothetical protein
MARQIVASLAALTAAFLAAGCATPTPPEPRYVTVYDCSEALETADGRFRADETFLSWRRDLADGVTIETGLSLPSPEARRRFAAQGFEGYAADLPRFTVAFDPRHGERNRWGAGVPPEVVSEVRLGERSAQEWLSPHGHHFLPWADVRAWLAEDPAGEFVFALRDTAGAPLQRATLPRDAFARAERTLQALHARAMVKAAARETLCPSSVHEEGEDIVVAGG